MRPPSLLAWLQALAGLLALCSCRFTREPVSPFANEAGAIAAASRGGGSGGSAAVGRAGHDGQSSTSNKADAASPGAAHTDGAADDEAAGGAGAAAGARSTAGTAVAGSAGTAVPPLEPDASPPPRDGSGSCAPAVEVCNPVTNEGCPPSMQCAVDLGAEVLAGYCIFSAPMPMLDGGCFNSGVTESCPPSSTCFEFQCRTLCFCDADCEQGQCCADPVGDKGFKVCGDC